MWYYIAYCVSFLLFLGSLCLFLMSRSSYKNAELRRLNTAQKEKPSKVWMIVFLVVSVLFLFFTVYFGVKYWC